MQVRRTIRGTDFQLLSTDYLETQVIRAGYNSVSYTHLRAHETVLDLVCRLLLEKKKNQIN